MRFGDLKQKLAELYVREKKKRDLATLHVSMDSWLCLLKITSDLVELLEMWLKERQNEKESSRKSEMAIYYHEDGKPDGPEEEVYWERRDLVFPSTRKDHLLIEMRRNGENNILLMMKREEMIRLRDHLNGLLD